jgi:hypothetical protein
MNTPNLTKEDLIQYYVDVLGYSQDDLKQSTFGDLLALLNNAQLSDCLQYNNIN